MINAQRMDLKILWGVVAVICLAAFAFMLYASLHEPAIVDEAAHIPAGYAYVHEFDFRLNPEHPPLVKALAALPLLLIQPQFPTDNSAWTKELNGQWAMGEQLLYKSGNDGDTIVALSRLMPMLLTLLTVVFIYFWSKKLMGGAWALLPTFLFAFSPTILAHGHYVTTDIGAAFGVLFATYFFLKYLYEPSPKNILIAGLALGVAELMKFSTVLLIPYFAILAAVHFFIKSRDLYGKYFWQTAARKFGQFILVLLAAFVLIYAAYAVFTANYPLARQASDTREILSSFGGNPPAAGQSCGLMRCLAEANIWMAGNHITRPIAEYFLGVLMVIQRSSGGNTAYFLGEVSKSGSHIYFPAVYLLKESLPALIIIFVALCLAIGNMIRQAARGQTKLGLKTYFQEHFTEFALVLFAVIYWTYSIRSTLNIGVRHLLPVIPLMYILAAGAWRKWVMGPKINPNGPALAAAWNAIKSMALSWLKFSVLCALLIWVILETFAAAPYFLSYFNQIGGGTWGGYRYVTDSNYDWGQDLRRFKNFMDAHPEIDKIAVDYFGTSGSPLYYLGDREVDWWSAKGNPADHGIHWLAVSINTLQSAIQPADYDFSLSRKIEDTYGWLTSSRPRPAGMGQVPEPDYRIGTTIFVYKL